MGAMRARRLITVLTAATLLIGAVGCDAAALNRWLVAHGKKALVEPELSKVTALITAAEQEQARRSSYVGKVDAVSTERLGLSWRPGCPVGAADLRLLTLSYWGFDGTGHTGEMIVNRSIALQTVAAFRELWNAKFPINRMDTAEKFATPADFNPDGTFIETHAPDLVNDTSAFFCRPPTGSSGWSQHSYGTAIDINPVQNPYVKGMTVIPPNGTTGRSATVGGTITAKSLPVAAMKRAGLIWGGTWKSLKDYMHFSKNGR
jgi:hypothetical protein